MMLKWFFKCYLATQNNKFLKYDRLFVLSFDIITKQYKVWYETDKHLLEFYESYNSLEEAKFAWYILMNRGKTNESN